MSYFDNIVFDENTLLESRKGEHPYSDTAESKYAKPLKQFEENPNHYSSSRYQYKQTPLEKLHIDKRDAKGDTLRNPKYGHEEFRVADKKTGKTIDNYKDFDTAYKAYSKPGSNSDLYITHKPNNDLSGKKKAEFDARVNKNLNARDYAVKVTKSVDKKYGHDSIESQSAKDAARRHYRRTHKEAVEMLKAYNPEFIEL